MSWVRKVLTKLGWAREVAKPPDVSQELHKEARSVLNDLRSVRRIEVIVRRR